MSDERPEKLRRYFEGDKFVSHSGIEIAEVGDDYAVTAADVLPCHLNAEGAVQGGMIYTLADFAFAVLTNSLHPTTVTQCAHVSYIRAARTARITATARETERAGHNCIVEVIVRDDEGRTVCVCNFNGFVSSKE